jgi:hypothetical protein
MTTPTSVQLLMISSCLLQSLAGVMFWNFYQKSNALSPDSMKDVEEIL